MPHVAAEHVVLRVVGEALQADAEAVARAVLLTVVDRVLCCYRAGGLRTNKSSVMIIVVVR